MLVRRQRLRLRLRDGLAALMRDAFADAETGVCNGDFLYAHLARHVRLAERSGRHLSLVLLRLASLEPLARDLGEPVTRDLLRQAGDWVRALVRVEDLSARTGAHEFCVLLPGTAPAEAGVAAARLKGVLAETEFGVGPGAEAVKLWVQASTAGLEPGDTVETLLARAREGLA